MTWEPLIPPLLLVPLVAAAMVAVVLSFRRHPVVLPSAMRAWLIGLRLGAVLLLGLFLANPLWQQTLRLAARGEVHVALDVSDSMNIPDESHGRSRLAAAQAVLRDWAQPLERRAEVRYYSMAERLDAQPLEALLDLVVAPGPSSNLGDAVEQLLARIEADAPAAVLLLTDGANNAGRDPETLVRRVQAGWAGPPVFAVGFGAITPLKDLELQRHSLPPRVFRNEPVAIRGALRQTGLEGQEAVVVIEEELLASGASVRPASRELYRARVALPPVGRSAVFEHAYTPAESGRRIIRLRAEPLPGEADTDNNIATARLDVGGDALRVLVLSSQPSPLYRAVYRALARDPRFSVRGIVQTRDQPPLVYEQKSDPGHPSRPLDGRESAHELDCVVLLDCGPRGPGGAPVTGVYEAVQAGKLSAIVAPGPRMLRDTAALAELAALLPCARPALLPSPRGPVRVAPEGESHPLAQAVAAIGELPALLARLPVPRAVLRCESWPPGATPLLELPDAPLVIHQQVGSGAVLTLWSPDLWQWTATGLPEADHRRARALFEALFIVAVRYMALGEVFTVDQPSLAVETNAERYAVGETALIEVIAQGFSEFRRPAAADVRAAVRLPDGREEVLALTESAAGRFTARLPLPLRGEYGVEARTAAGGGEVLAARALFLVQPLAAERAAASRRDDWLDALARATGGRYTPLAGIADVVEAIEPRDRELTITRPVPLFALPHLFVLLAGLLCTEWILRRRWDL